MNRIKLQDKNHMIRLRNHHIVLVFGINNQQTQRKLINSRQTIYLTYNQDGGQEMRLFSICLFLENCY